MKKKEDDFERCNDDVLIELNDDNQQEFSIFG